MYQPVLVQAETVVEIGAGFGYHSIRMGAILKLNSHSPDFFSYEHSVTFQLLHFNIQHNQLQHYLRAQQFYFSDTVASSRHQSKETHTVDQHFGSNNVTYIKLDNK